jgi:hypothetical protein
MMRTHRRRTTTMTRSLPARLRDALVLRGNSLIHSPPTPHTLSYSLTAYIPKHSSYSHTSWLGDGYCDQSCYNVDCRWDDGDCENVPTDSGVELDPCLNSGCPFLDWKEDGICDHDCFTVECEWDGGDCANELSSQGLCTAHSDCSGSSPFCYEGMCAPCTECHYCQDGVDGSCGLSCSTAEYPTMIAAANRANACTAAVLNQCTQIGCAPALLGDGTCDAVCNNEVCNYDTQPGSSASDCSACLQTGCPEDWVNDNYCDNVCNNAACEWDGGDCGGVGSTSTPSPTYIAAENPCLLTGCPSLAWMRDGMCDEICNNNACEFDGGDCAAEVWSECTSTGCPYTDWIGDGVCDANCNNAACNFDGGDCSVGSDSDVSSAQPSLSPTTTDPCLLTGCPSLVWIGDGECLLD